MTVPVPSLWHLTPVAVLALVAGIAHEIGLRRLARRQEPARRRRFRLRSLLFYGGLVAVALVASGPLERWSRRSLTVHMLTHVFEMFYLPVLLIVGAPWVPLVFALPVLARRRLFRWYHRAGAAAGLRWAHRVLVLPAVGVVLFNGAMIVWHLPAVYDWAVEHDWPVDWLMTPTYVLAGLLFWRVILPSHPWPSRGSTRMQVAAIVVTGFIMLAMAIALAVLSQGPWYQPNVVLEGAHNALRDQRWAAGVLWVCGDFWAAPALVLVAWRLYGSDGGVSASFERALGRTDTSAASGEAAAS
jgi:cytochrome c oxidase assembly factor CtaG